MANDQSFSKKVVAASVVAVVSYTAVLLALVVYNVDNHANVWPPAELTALWFGFWTVELVSLASIRKEKIKNRYEREENENGKQTDQP